MDSPPLLPTIRNPRHDQLLRQHLQIIRDHAPPQLARRIEDVLAGRATLRGLAASPDMDDFAGPLMDQAVDALADVPEVARAEMERAARAEYGGPHEREPLITTQDP